MTCFMNKKSFRALTLNLVGICLTMSFFMDAFSQQKKDFSVEFSAIMVGQKMNSVNDFINRDATYDWTNISNDDKFLNSLNDGFDYSLSVKYQISNYFDVGIYTNYNTSCLQRSFRVESSDPPPFIQVYHGEVKNIANAFSVGLSSDIYLNKLFNFSRFNSLVLQKVIWSIGLKGGYGKSYFIEKALVKEYTEDYRYYNFSASNFNGKVELALSYPLYDSQLFTHLGIKGGYNFYKSSALRTYSGNSSASVQSNLPQINVDFSGYYLGFFLRIGKH